MNSLKKIILIATVPLVLAGCGLQETEQTSKENSNQNTNQTSLIPNGKMNQNEIKASQVGLSDEKWNRSRPTISDGKDTNSKNEPTRILTEDAKSLVVYFSRSGSTELLTSKVQALSEADVLEIVVEDTYSSDYGKTVERANGERQEEGVPRLNMEVPDLSQYENIYLGSPIWAMTLSEPMSSFLEQYGERLAGKTVIPFSTNGSYGIGSSVSKIESILNSKGINYEITEPFTVEGNKVDKVDESLVAWFNRINKK